MKGRMPVGIPGNMNQMMKQVQKMQRDMERTQQELEQRIFEVSAGAEPSTSRYRARRN